MEEILLLENHVHSILSFEKLGSVLVVLSIAPNICAYDMMTFFDE